MATTECTTRSAAPHGIGHPTRRPTLDLHGLLERRTPAAARLRAARAALAAPRPGDAERPHPARRAGGCREDARRQRVAAPDRPSRGHRLGARRRAPGRPSGSRSSSTPARRTSDSRPAPLPGLVVVDDAHALPPATLRLIDSLLNEAPHGMRLLLLSRWDLPLTRLVPELLGHFTVLRGELLRMDPAESAAPGHRARPHRRPRGARAVIDRAQGWCAAVVLTARAIATSPDPVAAAAATRRRRLGRRPGGDRGVRGAPAPGAPPAPVPGRRGGREHRRPPPTCPTTREPTRSSPAWRRPACW